MLEAVLFSIAFVILAIAAYTDLRTREVPDWVNFAGIIAGIGLRALSSISLGDLRIVGEGVLGFIVFFAIAIVMYYTGQWGGGDSKLLMAMGALLGFGFSQHPATIFLMWTLLVGAAYGLVWSVVLAAKNKNAFLKQYQMLSRALRWVHVPLLGVFIFGLAFAIATDDVFLRVLSLVLGIAVPVLFYSALGIKVVEQCCMIKKIAVDKLTEGDWIAKPVTHKGKYLCGPKDLGITKAQIRELTRLKVKHVIVKEGIPFTPTFLIGFVLSLWLGSPL